MKFYLTIILLVMACSVGLATKNLWYLEDRSVMVQLFQWKWKDIADECEKFLGPKGFGGVLVSPPNENLVISGRPWWERYQPVSYLLATRSGDEYAFKNMVDRCNKVGVRIYVEAVINHMSSGKGIWGTAGSIAPIGDRGYPVVPYTAKNFNSPRCSVVNYRNVTQMRNCEQNGRHDLNITSKATSEKIVNYLNQLIDIGVAGFIIDAAKYVWTHELQDIYNRLNNLSTKYFPADARPYIAQDVERTFKEPENEVISIHAYTKMGAIIEHRFGIELRKFFMGEINLRNLSNWGNDMIEHGDGLNSVDDPVSQRGGLPSGEKVLTYEDFNIYRAIILTIGNSLLEYFMGERFEFGPITFKSEPLLDNEATAFALAHPYGEPRIMSGYKIDPNNTNLGPPQNINEAVISPEFKNEQCTNDWVCEHRWRQIYQMVEFRNVVKGTGLNDWWDNGSKQIAFCRGNKGFIAINREIDLSINRVLDVCLPPGTYCDIYSGYIMNNGNCAGDRTVVVDASGKAHISIFHTSTSKVLAIHEKSRIK